MVAGAGGMYFFPDPGILATYSASITPPNFDQIAVHAMAMQSAFFCVGMVWPGMKLQASLKLFYCFAVRSPIFPAAPQSCVGLAVPRHHTLFINNTAGFL